MRKVILAISFFIAIYASAQKFEAGFVYSPVKFCKLTFDKSYIVFDDYTSLTAGGNEFHFASSLLSSGVFFRYRMPHYYYQAEIDLFENRLRYSIPDWKTTRDKYFAYSTIDIPLTAGYTFNPGNVWKFHVFGGVNNKFGRFRTVVFSSLYYLIDDNKNFEYYSDVTKKRELINRFSFYYLEAIGGIGMSFYGFSFDIKAEKNITNLNSQMLLNSANYKDLVMIRLCLNAVIYYKRSKR